MDPMEDSKFNTFLDDLKCNESDNYKEEKDERIVNHAICLVYGRYRAARIISHKILGPSI